MGNGMLAERASDEPVHVDLIARLAALELPTPSVAADVPAAFALWLAAEAIDEDELVEIFGPRYTSTRRMPTAREEALTTLLGIVRQVPLRWLYINNYREMVEIVGKIENNLSPCEAVMEFLHGEAAAEVAAIWGRGLQNPRRLRDLFEGAGLSMLGGEVVELPFGARVSLGEAIEVVGVDGLGLWHLRANLPEHTVAFDAAVAARQARLMPAVKAGLKGLFDEPDRRGPGPIDYLSAFGRLLPEGIAIDIVLDGIKERIACRDGFAVGPDRATWFETLANLSGWRPEHLRSLLYLDRGWAALGDEALEASLTAMEVIAASDRRSAALCAFHVHRVARWAVEEERRLTNTVRLKSVEDRVREMAGCSNIMQITQHLAALPLPILSRDCAWEFFGKTTKAMWRDDVQALVEEDRELAHGLAEFLIAFTEPKTFDDVEPLLFELLHNAAGIVFLNELSEGKAYLAAMRARSVRRQMLTRSKSR